MANSEIPSVILLFSSSLETVSGHLNDVLRGQSRLSIGSDQVPAKGSFIALWDGLELDCQLADGPANLVVENRVFTTAANSSFQSSISISLSEKLRGGNRVAPIWSGLLEMAAYLADALSAECVYWSPSGNLIESGYFKDAIQSFVDGGAFPALALVRFDTSKEWVTSSTGLDWFSGQEIAASHPQLSARDAMYRLVRIAHDMAMIGPYENESQLDGLIEGERLSMKSEGQSGVVHIRISSTTDALLH